MSPFVLLLLLFALGGGKSKPQTRPAVMAAPDPFACGDVDAAAAEMAGHMRGTMTAEAKSWYADWEDSNPSPDSAIVSVLATWTYRTLAGTGGPQPFPWVRDGDGPFAWTADRDNPAELPAQCEAQIRQAVDRAWAIVALSL